jgi:hypothetical protein
VNDKLVPKTQNELAHLLSGLQPEELEPRLELQILIDPASLLSTGLAEDTNNNNNNNKPA